MSNEPTDYPEDKDAPEGEFAYSSASNNFYEKNPQPDVPQQDEAPVPAEAVTEPESTVPVGDETPGNPYEEPAREHSTQKKNNYSTPPNYSANYSLHGTGKDMGQAPQKSWRDWPSWLIEPRNQVLFSIASLVLSMMSLLGVLPAAYYLFALDGEEHEKDTVAKYFSIAALAVPLLGVGLVFIMSLLLMIAGGI